MRKRFPYQRGCKKTNSLISQKNKVTGELYISGLKIEPSLSIPDGNLKIDESGIGFTKFETERIKAEKQLKNEEKTVNEIRKEFGLEEINSPISECRFNVKKANG